MKPKLKSNSDKSKKKWFQLRFKSDAGRYVCCGGIVSGGREESPNTFVAHIAFHIK